MSTLRSKFESKFKERTKVNKKDNIVTENLARQRQSRAASINVRRAVATGFSPLKEELKPKPITRGSNAVEDRKQLLMKWKQEKEDRKLKELETKKKKEYNEKEKFTSKKATKPQESSISRPVGRPPKVIDQQKASISRQTVDKKQSVKSVTKDQSKKEVIKVTRTTRNSDSKIEEKRMTRSMQSKPNMIKQVNKTMQLSVVPKEVRSSDVLKKNTELSDVVKRGRGRPPTKNKQSMNDKNIIEVDDNKLPLNKSLMTPSWNISLNTRRQTMTPTSNSVSIIKKQNEMNIEDDVIDVINKPANISQAVNTPNRIDVKKSLRNDRRRTIGTIFPTCSTPKRRSSVEIKDVALIATEGRKRGRPVKINRRKTSFQQVSDEPMEIDIQSSFSTDAVFGSVDRKRGRPPKDVRRRTVAVGNVTTPKFFMEGIKRSRRSLEPILKSFEVGDGDVLVVSTELNKKKVIEKNNEMLVVSITNEVSGDVQPSPEPTPRRRGRKSNINSFNHGDVAGGDDHILYSLAEEDEDEAMNRESKHDNEVKETVNEEDDDENDKVLYSLLEESSVEEKESPVKKKVNEACATPLNGVRKRGRPPKILNQSAMAQLESTPIRTESIFKTPLPKSNSKNKRYSLSVEALKSDPKKCLKSFILRNLSPSESIEVLRHSPMIEMTRRKPRFDMEDIENVVEERCRFSDLMDKEKEHLLGCCGMWKKCLEDEMDISEEVQGQIRVAVGKAELLMKERFNQFNELIKDHLTKRSEKPVTEEDLQGFWDMVLCQVADVDAMLDNLKILKENNWVPKVAEIAVSPPKKKKIKASSKPVGVSKFAQFRKKFLENQNSEATAEKPIVERIVVSDVIHIENSHVGNNDDVIISNMDVIVMDTNDITTSNDDNTKRFDGGFFVVESPLKVAVLDNPRTNTGRISMTSDLKTLSSHKIKKTPFFLKDHSYFAKTKRDSIVQKISFDKSPMADRSDHTIYESPNVVMSQVRRRSSQGEAKGNRRSIRFNANDSLNESISHYLKPSETSWFESPLHHPILTPSPGCIGDLMSFSPSSPVKNAKSCLRKSVLMKSSGMKSHLP